MTTKDIVVIGSSAGGVDALCRLCAALPADLPATIFVAQHISPSAKSLLPQLIARSGPLPALTPVDGQAFERGHIYVAGPDHHLLVRPGQMLVRRGPYENRTRPAINPLFRSAALAYGSRVVGIILTGLLDDGTDGLIAIKAAGGTSIVQDPDDAEWPSMPRNAVRRDHVDLVVTLDDLAAHLTAIVSQAAGPSIPLPEEYTTEDLIAAQEFAIMEPHIRTPGQASPLSCPDCGGVLNEIHTGTESRFRCQVGHAFTPLGLAEAQASELERALAVAVRTHRDRIRLFDKMADNARARGMPHAVARWQEASAESEQMIAILEQATSTLRKPKIDEVG
jgi:two-component system, chemotaxis family, protein-glutamate methylesterase/glutaminase